MIQVSRSRKAAILGMTPQEKIANKVMMVERKIVDMEKRNRVNQRVLELQKEYLNHLKGVHLVTMTTLTMSQSQAEMTSLSHMMEQRALEVM